MRGYVIARITVTDPDAYSEYRNGVLATVEPHGGKYLVRGGPFDCLEGEWPNERVVVIEFPSVEQARAWYQSEDYQTLAGIRQSASRGTLILIAGAES
jgi:uncharacterized protein (DUF1330 family)